MVQVSQILSVLRCQELEDIASLYAPLRKNINAANLLCHDIYCNIHSKWRDVAMETDTCSEISEL